MSDHGGQVRAAAGVRDGSHIIEGHDQHTYHFNRVMTGGRISLRCSFAKTKEFFCRGRASVDSSGRNFKATQPHTHPKQTHFFEARKFRTKVLDRCKSGDWAPLRVIYNQERRKFRWVSVNIIF